MKRMHLKVQPRTTESRRHLHDQTASPTCTIFDIFFYSLFFFIQQREKEEANFVSFLNQIHDLTNITAKIKMALSPVMLFSFFLF